MQIDLTACVFDWEERAVESSRFMFERIRELLAAVSQPRTPPPPEELPNRGQASTQA